MRQLTITPESFRVEPRGIYYTGPLISAKMTIGQDRWVKESRRLDTHFVSLYDDPYGLHLAETGVAETSENAWRYALGAYLGPVETSDSSYTVTVDDGAPFQTTIPLPRPRDEMLPVVRAAYALLDDGGGDSSWGALAQDEYKRGVVDLVSDSCGLGLGDDKVAVLAVIRVHGAPTTSDESTVTP